MHRCSLNMGTAEKVHTGTLPVAPTSPSNPQWRRLRKRWSIFNLRPTDHEEACTDVLGIPVESQHVCRQRDQRPFGIYFASWCANGQPEMQHRFERLLSRLQYHWMTHFTSTCFFFVFFFVCIPVAVRPRVPVSGYFLFLSTTTFIRVRIEKTLPAPSSFLLLQRLCKINKHWIVLNWTVDAVYKHRKSRLFDFSIRSCIRMHAKVIANPLATQYLLRTLMCCWMYSTI